MEQMKAELLGNEPKETPAAEPEVERPASAMEFPAKAEAEKPAEPAVAKEEPESEKKEPEPGAGKEEPKPEESKEKEEEKPKGKFEPKEEKVPEGVQKRINKMTFEKHQAERDKEALARENAELRAKLDSTQATDKPATEKSDKPASAAAPAPVKPKQDDFETIEEYLDARDKYILALQETKQRQLEESIRQREVEAQQREAKQKLEQQEQELAKSWGERVAETAKDHPEILEVVNGQLGKFIGGDPDTGWKGLPGVADSIRRSEVGPEIMLYMQEHAEETVKAANPGSEIEFAKYVGRVEAQILSSKPTPKSKTTEIPRSKDLPPPPKVAGGQTNAPKGIDLNDDKTSFEDWRREAIRELTAAS